MKIFADHAPRELIAAIAARALVFGVFIGSWLAAVSTMQVLTWDVLVALSLVCAVAATYKYPIHIRPHTKIHMNTVPLYLCAVLLPVPFAVWVIGTGTLT